MQTVRDIARAMGKSPVWVDSLEQGIRNDYKLFLIDWQPGGRRGGRPKFNDFSNRVRISYRYEEDAPAYSLDEKGERFVHWLAAHINAASHSRGLQRSRFGELLAEANRFREVIPESMWAHLQALQRLGNDTDYTLRRITEELHRLGA